MNFKKHLQDSFFPSFLCLSSVFSVVELAHLRKCGSPENGLLTPTPILLDDRLHVLRERFA